MENENVKNLLELVVENPDLPIVCMVESEIVYDFDYSRWLAQIGYCVVGEFASYKDRFYCDREEFKEEYYDRNDEILCERFGYDPWKSPCTGARGKYSDQEIEKNSAAEKKLDAYLDEIAERSFVRCIIVNIDLPDDIQFGEVHDEPIVYEEE
jgi:hypothetical protein